MAIGGHDWKAFGLGLLEASLLVTAAFSVATVFDEWHRFLELFVHFRLQYLVIAVLLSIAFAMLRWRGYVLLGLATVALNAWFVVPWYMPVAHAAAGTEVRLLHANVFVRNTDGARFTTLAREFDPDIIVMQEVTPAFIQSLAELDILYPHKLVEARENAYGIALYSKYPLRSSAIVESAPLGLPEVVATLDVGGRALNLVSGHPLHPLGAENYGARNLQLDELAEIARRTPEPLIVIGDLNVTMWSHHYRSFEEKSGLRNARLGFGIKPSWPLFMPFAMIPIDHCLVSNDIEVSNFRTGSNIGSDHLPILVSLSLTGTE